MPEKFRANESERGGFWFWKKSSLQSKQRRNIYVPAKDIISQANDVVNKCILGKESEIYNERNSRKRAILAVCFLSGVTMALGIMVYYLIN